MKQRAREVPSPLAGRRILLTRALEDSAEFAGALRSLGAQVAFLPLLRFAAAEDSGPLDRALRDLQRFAAILFLSRNAVRYVLDRCQELKILSHFSSPGRPFIAAVGPGTQAAAAERGLPVDFVARRNTAQALLRQLGASLSRKTVLLPRSDRGDERIAAQLGASGPRLTQVIAYRTLPPESLDPALLGQLRRARFDSVVFASPSAVHNLRQFISAAELRKLSARTAFAAFGPTTASAIRHSGARVSVQAPKPTPSALAGALTSFFSSRGARARKSPEPRARRS